MKKKTTLRERRLERMCQDMQLKCDNERSEHEDAIYKFHCERDETVAVYKDALQEQIAKRNKLEKIFPKTGLKSLEQVRDGLTDIAWFIKGMKVMADAKSETCDFSESHVEAIRFVMERLKAEIQDQMDTKAPVPAKTHGGMI